MTDHRSNVLISVSDLVRLVGHQRLVLLDVGGIRPGPGRDGRGYGIPGAVPVDLATELAGPGGGVFGARPLPDIGDLQAVARRWGIQQDSDVVVYDDKSGLQAARGWWVLRWAGASRVRLLDGGLAAWERAGHALTPLDAEPAPGDVILDGGHLPTLSADEAGQFAKKRRLLDAREAGAFKAGHIPGARNAPASGNLTENGTFETGARLAERYTQYGVGQDRLVGVSCGSGVSATHDILALASVGVPAALYVASWSGWIADSTRPVATGE
ncbi:sulfurtransferase, partial [Rhizobiaceae sp. 2RAB30]